MSLGNVFVLCLMVLFAVISFEFWGLLRRLPKLFGAIKKRAKALKEYQVLSLLNVGFQRLRRFDQYIARNLVARPRDVQISAPESITTPSDDTSRNSPRIGEETSSTLITEIFQAIKRRDHVLLIGPRGSGKSHAAREAIVKAEREGVLVPGAQIVAQGNKELPRDYFFEPEFEFFQEKGGVLSTTSTNMRLRQPPLFRHAKGESGHVHLQLVKGNEQSPTDMIAHYETEFKIKIETDTTNVDHFVLFLDEVNRFNDGVLDSLLLLLEEGYAIYQGKLVKVPISVIATMNPPGYDISARSLSPPLLSRFNIVKQLYTAGPKTLANIILPQALGKAHLSSDDQSRLRCEVFAVVIILFWGQPDDKRSSAAYLSPDAQELIKKLLEIGTREFKEGMKLISEKCNYGPDARGVRDWIMAVKRRLSTKDGNLPSEFLDANDDERNKNLATAAIDTLSDAIANKLVLNFSPDAKPHEFRELMNAMGTVTHEVFTAKPMGEVINKYFSTKGQQTAVE